MDIPSFLRAYPPFDELEADALAQVVRATSVEFFPAAKQPQVRSILAGVLRGVISQRLLPRVDGGRVAAVEVMVSNARIQELIRENKPELVPEAIAEGAFFQMQTLTKALIDLVLSGDVDEETAAAASPNRHDFMIALDRALKEHALQESGDPATDAEPRLLRVKIDALPSPSGGRIDLR